MIKSVYSIYKTCLKAKVLYNTTVPFIAHGCGGDIALGINFIKTSKQAITYCADYASSFIRNA